ncbi:MAG: EAL domain-containing protein [Magnetococcales bacterium]|nr:EAL domain-containing protein [Magnetococcales bacterium]
METYVTPSDKLKNIFQKTLEEALPHDVDLPIEQKKELLNIVHQQHLTPIYQPVVDFCDGRIFGFQGRIRGPSHSRLHAPDKLFQVAERCGMVEILDHISRVILLQRFHAIHLTGWLFLKLALGKAASESPRVDLSPFLDHLLDIPVPLIMQVAQEADQEVIQKRFPVAVHHLDVTGMVPEQLLEQQIQNITVDRYFIQNIDIDLVKQRHLAALGTLAQQAGARLIAQGIETREELRVAKSLGVTHGMGFLLGRPRPDPLALVPVGVKDLLLGESGFQDRSVTQRDTIGNKDLVRSAPVVSPETHNIDVLGLFQDYPHLDLLPVMQNGEVVGLLNRHAFMERLARPFHHDLFGRKPCSLLMEKEPHVVGVDISIQELSKKMLNDTHRALASGYIVYDQDNYVGVGTVHELLRVLTEMQIQGARHANPLTLLPGNVPINDTANLWIEGQIPFIACYCDLDHFKPYNDVYGFKKGDSIIQATASVLSDCVEHDLDFLGHIGGDDFIILFRSTDWEARCQRILAEFAKVVVAFFDLEHVKNSGYESEDRQGKRVFHPLTSLSLGVVVVEPGRIASFMEISRFAAEAKKQAKKIPGNSLFVNRRQPVSLVKPVTSQPVEVAPEEMETAGVEVEKDQLMQKLRECHFKDHLTGLPNRRLLKDRLKQAMRQVRGTQEIIAMVLLAPEDGAMTSFDNLAMDSEERLLGKMARRLRQIKRKVDTLARWSDREFAFIFNGLTNNDQVALMVERLRESLNQPFLIFGKESTVRVNMGVAIFPQDGEKPDLLIKNAVTALRKARELGYGHWEFYESGTRLEMEARLHKIEQLRRAIHKGEFTLCYQPKWNPQAHRFTGFEALVRMHLDGNVTVSPMEFIPLAEESGLILPLGEWIIQTACHQARAWLDAGMQGFTMAINLSPRQLLDPNFPKMMHAALDASGIPPHMLEFEITESVVMQSSHQAVELLGAFQSLGITVALDDFGTGFSSLSRLHRLPIQTLKIDRSFVQDIHLSSKSEGIVAAIIALGRNHGLQIVAEGVENLEQFNILSRAGCDELQGFYIHRPLDPDHACRIFRDPDLHFLLPDSR